MRALGAAVLTCVAVGCGTQPEALPSVHISGQLSLTQDAGESRFVFSADKTPKLVLTGAAWNQFEVRSLRHPEHSFRGQLLQASTSTLALKVPKHWQGDDTLTVSGPQVDVSFPVRWAPNTADWPLFDLVNAAASPIHQVAFWAIDALALAAYRSLRREAAAAWWASFVDEQLAQVALGFAASRLRLSVFLDTVAGRYRGLAARLKTAESYALAVGDGQGVARGLLREAHIRRDTGERFEALRLARRAEAVARQSGATVTIRAAFHTQSLIMTKFGRFRESLALLEASKPPATQRPRERANYLGNLAWQRLLAMLAGDLPRDFPQVLELYERARKIWGQDHAPEVNNLRTRVAFVMHQMDDPRTDDLVGELVALPPEELGGGRVFIRLLAIERQLKHRRFEEAVGSLRSFIAEQRLEFDDPLNVELCNAEILYGQALAGAGEAAAAIEVFESATGRVEALARSLAVPRTRVRFHHGRRHLAIAYAQLLIHRGDLKGALEVLSRARAVTLNELEGEIRVGEQSTAWRAYEQARSRHERQRREGCAHLVQAESMQACRQALADARARAEQRLADFYAGAPALSQNHAFDLEALIEHTPKAAAIFVSGTKDTPWAFVLNGGQLSLHQGADVAAKALRSAAAADHVFVVPSDISDGPDLHELAYVQARSLSLIPHLGVLTQAPSDRPQGEAVVVADADGTLPHAAIEGRLVVERLSARAFIGSVARRDDVLAVLKTAPVFHFSGHTQDPHHSGSALGLQLGGGQYLAIEDLLRVRPAPRLAFLAACSSGSSIYGGRDTLAAAFVQTGAQAVVATVEPLKDGASAKFVDAFYEAGGAREPVTAFSVAVRDAMKRGDPVWKSLRLWGRPNSLGLR